MNLVKKANKRNFIDLNVEFLTALESVLGSYILQFFEIHKNMNYFD